MSVVRRRILGRHGIGFAVFIEGAAYGRVRDIVLHHNYAPGNAGIVLYWETLAPLVQLVLLLAPHRLSPLRQSSQS